MNRRQEVFIQEYLVDLNGAAAARRAGFSPKHARATACRLLKNPEVKAAIDAALEKRRQETEISAKRVMDHISGIAFAEAQGAAVSNKVRCLELLAKLLGMFDTGGNVEPVTVVEDL